MDFLITHTDSRASAVVMQVYLVRLCNNTCSICSYECSFVWHPPAGCFCLLIFFLSAGSTAAPLQSLQSCLITRLEDPISRSPVIQISPLPDLNEILSCPPQGLAFLPYKLIALAKRRRALFGTWTPCIRMLSEVMIYISENAERDTSSRLVVWVNVSLASCTRRQILLLIRFF